MISARILGAGLKRPTGMMKPSLVARNMLIRNFNSVVSKKQAMPVMATMSPILKQVARYSTATAPPPPPPPPKDKNAKGRQILSRISRAITFSASTLLVIGATGIAALVVYLILSELFLPSGDTKTFNKALKLLEKNEEARAALQLEPHERVRAYGESVAGKWVRNRPVQSIRTRGKDGKDRLVMKFHVESNAGIHGTVSLEQIDKSFFSSEFAYVALDLVKQKRIYLIEPKFQPKNYVPKFGKGTGFLGVKWGPKKDDE